MQSHDILVPTIIEALISFLSCEEIWILKKSSWYFNYILEEFDRIHNADIATKKFPPLFCLYKSSSSTIVSYANSTKYMMGSFLYKEAFLHYHSATSKYQSLTSEHLPSLPAVIHQCSSIQNHLYLQYINPEKQWGLFTGRLIPPQTMICIYFGELISTSEMRARYHQSYDHQGMNYILSIREHSVPTNTTSNPSFVLNMNIDATTVGDIARFVNHSCTPNCDILLYRSHNTEHGKDIIGIPVFQSNRWIYPLEEITIAYGVNQIESNSEHDLERLNKRQRLCGCGSKECLGYLPCLR